MITHDEAAALVESKVKHPNLKKHIYAVEGGMIRLAEHFREDVVLWGLTGLLHDLDYDQTVKLPDRHTFITEEWLRPYDLPEEMLAAIRCHPGYAPCRTRLDWALYTTDPTTGFLVACALMHPEKRLASVDVDFMLRRFGEKRFAAGATRENIQACSNLGLALPEFLSLIKEGMLRISDRLGL